jgi:hypothetical protein
MPAAHVSARDGRAGSGDRFRNAGDAPPAGEAILKVLTIRNPSQAEHDRLLMPIKPPDIEEEE